MIKGLRERRPLLYSLYSTILWEHGCEDHHSEGLHDLFYQEKRDGILLLNAPAAACAIRPKRPRPTTYG